MNENSPGVTVWWLGLSIVSVFNIALWTLSAATLSKEIASLSPEVRVLRRRQLLLSAGFVFGCAFRSFLPRADVQRICLYDSWLSSVFIGRSVATIAELCFMAQAALHLRALARGAQVPASVFISRLIVPLIAVAETCSWYAVLTTDYIGNACEESIWALCGGLLFLASIPLWSRCSRKLRYFLLVPFVFGPAYLAFMCTVDIPMYLSRWHADQLAGRPYFTLISGLHDVTHRWIATRGWEDWRTEMPWMSLYFSAAVWVSIALTRAPLFERVDERI